FVDGHWVSVPGGGASVEETSGSVYIVLSLRNVGAGIAVLQAWYPHPELQLGGQAPPPAVERFRTLTRDQHTATGDVGLWQAAMRDASDPTREALVTTIAEGRSFTVDLLYTDQIGGQRTISRFGVLRENDNWIGTSARHWYLDTAAPR